MLTPDEFAARAVGIPWHRWRSDWGGKIKYRAARDATRKAFSKPAAPSMLSKELTLKKYITAERLRELLHYDPETGIFTRRIPSGGRNWKKFPAGSRVGSLTKLGYVEAGVDGESYLLHRLAILYTMSRWPLDQVDHINGKRADNRWSNLREVDNTTNIENRWRPNKNNRSGFLGVHFESGKWVAQITVMRECIFIGRFGTPEEAHAAYITKKREVHKGNTL